jgi:hypothetical protein
MGHFLNIPSDFFKIRCNIILPLTISSSMWTAPAAFPHQIIALVSQHSCVAHNPSILVCHSQYPADSKVMKHFTSQFVQPPLTWSFSCTNPCVGSRAMLPNYTSFSEGSLSVLNDFILTDSDFLLRAALWSCNLPVSSLILLSQAWQVDLSTEFSQNTEGIKIKKRDVAWRQEENVQACIKTVEIISQHFIPCLTQISKNCIQKRDARRKKHTSRK